MLTRDAVDAFLTAKNVKGLSARTLETYRYRLQIFTKHCEELPRTPGPIESFLLSTGPTVETRETYFRLVRNLYRWLVARRWIAQRANPIPRVEAPRIRPKPQRAYSRAELRRIFTSDDVRPVVRAFLWLLADTACRLDEIRTLDEWSYQGDGILLVRGKTGYRLAAVTENVWNEARPFLPFPWSNHSSASLAIRRALRRVGITGRRSSAITFRHTFARLFEGDRSDLQHLLGHKSPRMVNTVYAPVDPELLRKAHRRGAPIRREHYGQRQFDL